MMRKLGVSVNVLVDGEEILLLRESGSAEESTGEQESEKRFNREMTGHGSSMIYKSSIGHSRKAISVARVASKMIPTVESLSWTIWE